MGDTDSGKRVMPAGKPPSIPQTDSVSTTQHSASDRALQIQQALKGIVLQTAYALRSRAQLAKLNASSATFAPRGISAANAADESATSLEPLGAECAQYLALVRGLRDYLLHAQAALEIELEATTKREANQAEQAAEAMKKQQAAGPSGAESGQTKPGEAANAMDEDRSTQTQAESSKPASGTVAGEAIVIDDDKDEDDVPLSRNGASTKDKPVDLTDSPDLPLLAASSGVQTSAPSMPVSQPGLGNANTGLGLNVDFSELGMNLDSLPNLSSFDLPSSSQAGDGSALTSSDNNFSDLGKMMGIDLSSLGGSSGTTGLGMDDFSSFANLQSDSLGNTLSTTMDGGDGSNDMDFFGGGDNGVGLDLSSFDFSSLGGDGDFGGNGSNGGGVDLSAFLNTFGANQTDDNNAS